MKSLEATNKEIKTTDTDGNIWKIAIIRDAKKTNVYSLSFFYNGKEFLLRRMYTAQATRDVWEMIEGLLKTSKSKKTPNDSMDTEKPKEKPKKRDLKDSKIEKEKVTEPKKKTEHKKIEKNPTKEKPSEAKKITP